MNCPVDVVYLIGQLSIGGTERQLLLLVENLDRTKFRPSVICLSEHATLAASFQALGCPTFVLHRPHNGHIRTLFQTCMLIRRIRPSILHSFGFAGRAGILASRVSGSPFNVVSIRTDPYWLSYVDRLLDALVISSADIVLANSQQALATLRSRGRVASLVPRVIYNGIDLHTFDHLLTDSWIVPGNGGENGHYEPGQTICWIGTLRPVKDLKNLLEAFAIVLDSAPNARLWVVGDGPLRGDLEELGKKLQIDGNVVFWGMRSDVPVILRKATIGVISSRIEGLCNAIIEYMAAHLPVVATNVGGNSELVIHGETGLLVPPQDPQTLAKAILYVLRNPGVAYRFGRAGRRYVAERFTVQRMVKETESVYEELLASGGR